MATAEHNGQIRLWEISERQTKQLKQLWKKDTRQKGILSIRFSPDSRRIAIAGWDGTVRLWDRRSAKEIDKFEGCHKGPIRSISFSRDGDKLATAGEDGRIVLWELNSNRNKKCKNSWSGHQGWIWSVSFSPKENLLVTSGEDGQLRFWDFQGNLKYHFDTQQGRVTSAIFSPNGEKIATAGWDGTVRLWIQTKQIRQTQLDNQLAKWNIGSPVTSMSFSPDGEKIAAATLDGQVILKTIEELDELINRGCKLIKQLDPEPQKLQKSCKQSLNLP